MFGTMRRMGWLVFGTMRTVGYESGELMEGIVYGVRRGRFLHGVLDFFAIRVIGQALGYRRAVDEEINRGEK